jgi:MoaA/NifB/PqqE/SkfB family radical SAM enzyme
MRYTNLWTYRRILLSSGFVSAVRNARKNVRDAAQGRPLRSGPYMAELDVTYRCNCRCAMCQRWTGSSRGELSLSEYRDLAGTLREMGTHQVSIAGGEPLLRSDACEIVEAFAARSMSVNICTNGLLLEATADRIRSSGATCITVSLDGASKQTHDRIRGVPGSFDRIVRGIERMMRYPPSRRPIVRVRMTFSEQNAGEIGDFCAQWRELADDVLLQPVHYCVDAFYTGDESAFRLDPGVVAEQLSGTPFEGDGYMQRLLHSLEVEGGFPLQSCYAGILMARIDPWGGVYPCLAQHVRIGSVRERDFRSIWNSAASQTERARLANGRGCRCWFNNTALIGHYGSLLEKPVQQALRAFARRKDR